MCVCGHVCCIDSTALANMKDDDDNNSTHDMRTSTPSEHKGLHVRQGKWLILCVGFTEYFYFPIDHFNRNSIPVSSSELPLPLVIEQHNCLNFI